MSTAQRKGIGTDPIVLASFLSDRNINMNMDAASASKSNPQGYAWAVSAGFNAALAAISTKLPLHQFVRYGLVVLFNVTTWGCYVNSLKALSSLQATVTNFATNFISSGLAGFFFFHESLSLQACMSKDGRQHLQTAWKMEIESI